MQEHRKQPESRLPKANTYNLSDLRRRYEQRASRIIAHCVLGTEMVGGMSADKEGIRAFATHHLGLSGQELEDAITRIMKEEIGDRDVAPEGGELKERLTYGINVVRRSPHGPWLKDHMVKACLKASASRLGIFKQKIGSKGDMAEMGEVRATGASLIDLPERIYFRSEDGTKPAQTYFKQFKGRVNLPGGAASIINDCECVPAGSRFEFEFRYFPTKIHADDIIDIMACAMVVGLGSAKAFECGKFQIVKLEHEERMK